MATATYVPISSTSIGSAAASITLSSIPSTYTDLVLISNVGLSVNNNSLYLQFNGNTTNLYSMTSFEAYNSSYDSYRLSTQTKMAVGGVNIGFSTDANQFGMTTSNIFDYANTSIFKTVIGRWNSLNDAGSKETGALTGIWRSTAAITSISLFSQSGNLSANSNIALYGIKAE